MSEIKKTGGTTEIIGPRDLPTRPEGQGFGGTSMMPSLPSTGPAPPSHADTTPSRGHPAPAHSQGHAAPAHSQGHAGPAPAQGHAAHASSPSHAAPTHPSAPQPQGELPEAGPGTILDGKYRLERLLGAGGMGAVFAGMQTGLSRRVAVKTMHRHIATNSTFARRFQREALAVARLEHPNVVQIFDSGQDAATGTLYLVMEFLDGVSLGDWLKNLSAPPPLADVEDILRQVLDAFDVAHRAGIVHRDLKPDNIFLARDHAGRRVIKIVDFGIAHVDDAPDKGKDPTLTREGSVAGTPAYMSPEQCRSLSVGPSTDLYAVGCVLTALLQLRPPFSANTIMDLMTHQLFMPPPPLDRPPGSEPVPPLLERLRLELLSKSPADRPPTAAAARSRLAEAFSLEVEQERLPPRKVDEPLGARSERAVQWERTKETRPEVSPVNVGFHAVGLVRFTAAEEGVSDTCVTGLAAHQIYVRPLRAGEPPPPVVIFDIGQDIAAAHSWLAELARVAPGSKGIIAMADVTTDGINALIEAGAAHVQPYPVRPDALAKVVGRILRRRR